MGVYEDHNLEQGMFKNPKAVEIKGFINHTQEQRWFPTIKQKKERLVIVILLLVIIVLIIFTIITNNKRLASSHGNDKEYEKKSFSTPDPTGNETVRKNQNSAPCEDDWIWYRGKCYYFSTNHATWENSLEHCREHDASLALIDNKEEYNFLIQRKGPDNHWIGLRRTDDNTGWTWINGTLYNESLFPIRRSSSESIERVFLNHEGVNSKEGGYEFKWICNKT